jgi:hypothetical protein
MSTYTEPTDLLLLEPAHLASHLRAVVENGIRTLAARYDEASASTPPANGGWSAKEVIGHLIDSAGNNIQSTVRLSIDPKLRIPGYKQAEWGAGLPGSTTGGAAFTLADAQSPFRANRPAC